METSRDEARGQRVLFFGFLLGFLLECSDSRGAQPLEFFVFGVRLRLCGEVLEIKTGVLDHTRRRQPDAFSKTVPIWCAVVSAVVLEKQNDEPLNFLHLPASVPDAESHGLRWARHFKSFFGCFSLIV